MIFCASIWKKNWKKKQTYKKHGKKSERNKSNVKQLTKFLREKERLIENKMNFDFFVHLIRRIWFFYCIFKMDTQNTWLMDNGCLCNLQHLQQWSFGHEKYLEIFAYLEKISKEFSLLYTCECAGLCVHFIGIIFLVFIVFHLITNTFKFGWKRL